MTNQLTSRVITLTPDELARWERGERHWIEPGVRFEAMCIRPEDCETPDQPNHSHHIHYVPHWRWRDAVGPCPTCGGTGTTRIHYAAAQDGRCPHCRGTGLLLTELRAVPALSGHDAIGHPGSVLVATVSVEVLPVYAHGELIPVGWMKHVAPDQHGQWFIWHGPNVENGENPTTGRYDWKRTPITLDPLPTPGRDFVVVLTEVAA